MRTWLRIIRIARGMTEKQVAEKVGIAQPVYHRIEKGQGNPKVENAKKIASVLGFDWTKFYPDKKTG